MPGYDSQHTVISSFGNTREFRGIQGNTEPGIQRNTRDTRQYRGIQGNTGKYMGTQGNRTLLQIEPSFSCGFANTPLQ